MNKRPILLLLSGALCLAGVQSASAATSFVGVSVPWIQGQTGTLAGQTDADTVGGNAGWNAYVRPVGGSFLNSGNGASTRFSIDLEPGLHTFEILLQSPTWADNSPDNPGSYLNLYFDGDRANPGISARLAGGNTGDLLPLTAGDLPMGVALNDAGGMSAPSGSLSSGEVTLTSLEFLYDGVGDQVRAFDNFPGDGADSMLVFTLDVIPEPSSSLLALLGLGLFFRRRR